MSQIFFVIFPAKKMGKIGTLKVSFFENEKVIETTEVMNLCSNNVCTLYVWQDEKRVGSSLLWLLMVKTLRSDKNMTDFPKALVTIYYSYFQG